jgi:hypothetical protein
MKVMLLSTMLLGGTKYSYGDEGLAQCQTAEPIAATILKLTNLCPTPHRSYVARCSDQQGKLGGDGKCTRFNDVSVRYQGIIGIRDLTRGGIATGAAFP